MSERKIKLSLNKFSELLSKHKYSLVTSYCELNDGHLYEARFFECRTPKYQKTFAVTVPSKYLILIDDTAVSGGDSLSRSPLKRHPITRVNAASPKQVEFMELVKGGIECDLVGVSSTSVCLVRNGVSDVEAYVFSDLLHDDDAHSEASSDTSDVDMISQLEEGASSLLQNLTENTRDEGDEVVVDPIASASEGTGASTGAIDLVFEDDEGVELEEKGPIREMMDAANAPSTAEPTQLPPIKDVSHEKEDDDDSSHDANVVHDNGIPSNLPDSEITLGAVYVSIDLNSFFKEIEKYEDKAMSIYNQLDENELESKSARVMSIKNQLIKVSEHLDSKLAKLKEEETKIKHSLTRLTKVLTQTDEVRKKMLSVPVTSTTAGAQNTLSAPDTSEVDKIFAQTKSTINELNLSLLKIRDDTEDLLTTTETYLGEILEE